MRKREDLDKDLKELLEMATCVLGDVEEFATEDLRELLEVLGPNREELLKGFYRKLKSVIESMRKEGKAVPDRYREVLEQVRPLSEPTRDPRYMQSRARAWIERMLREVKIPPRAEVAVAFRNKGEISKSDEEVLKTAEERLRKRAQERGAK